MVRLFGVSKAYRKESAALKGVSFRISKGEFVYINGPSGAGKSTLLKLLYCGERPSRGQILLDGQNVMPKRLLDAGFRFRFEWIEDAIADLI